MFRNRNIFFLAFCFYLFIYLLISFTNVGAQCPMCKANVEAAQRRGEKVGLGLNTGILFLLSMPYLVVGTLGVVWYIYNRKKQLVGNSLAPPNVN